MSESNLCPTCKQPLPHEPMSYGTGPSTLPACDYGPTKHPAHFIVNKVAVCKEHLPLVTKG